MQKIIPSIALTFFVLMGCNTENQKPCYSVKGYQSQVIVDMIEAVNQKNAEDYVAEFAKNVRVSVGSTLKVKGQNELKANRARHFKTYPNLRSEIQYLIEIDNKVIMHDKVWLNPSEERGKDIVEIFVFEDGKVMEVDVIQSKDFFQ
jgi:hypothetical protein